MTIGTASLQFQFKGHRNYVQGTDIYSKINQVILKDTDCHLAKLKFIELLRFNAIFLWDQDGLGLTDKISPCATGEIYLKTGCTQSFKIVPDTHSKISDRSDYQEDQITSKLSIDQKHVFLNDLTGFSLIEEVVASIKHFSNLIVPPKTGKWLFAGIQLKESMPASRDYGQALKVVQRQIVANRFSKNDFYLGDKAYGTIEFTIGEV
tara:strand:- start:2761 stop:3381 length:621 start_codon:yes stop_codon:yes gene_type:complete